MYQALSYAAALATLSGCDGATNLLQAEPVPMIEARPQNDPLLRLELHVPTRTTQSFVDALARFAEIHSFDIDVDVSPNLPRMNLVSGITNVRMSRGNERIDAINPFSREEFVITITTERTGQVAHAVLNQLAEEIRTYLRRTGFEI